MTQDTEKITLFDSESYATQRLESSPLHVLNLKKLMAKSSEELVKVFEKNYPEYGKFQDVAVILTN